MSDDILEMLEVIEEEDPQQENEVTVERARELTETIKSTAQGVYLLVAMAHEMRVDRALGYTTWAEYCETEFNMSASRSYQLINLSETVKAIEAVTPEGTEIRLTEAQARDIKRELPAITEQIEEATKNMGTDEASSKVHEIIEVARSDKHGQNDESDKGAQDVKSGESGKGDKGAQNVKNDQDDNSGDPGNFGDFDESDNPGNFGDFDKSGQNEDWDDTEWKPSNGLTQKEAINVHKILTTLETVLELPEPREVAAIVPPDKKSEIDEQLDGAVEWLNRFKQEWSNN